MYGNTTVLREKMTVLHDCAWWSCIRASIFMLQRVESKNRNFVQEKKGAVNPVDGWSSGCQVKLVKSAINHVDIIPRVAPNCVCVPSLSTKVPNFRLVKSRHVE